MRGLILGFSISENIGYISGDDGKRYTFIGQEWREQYPPLKGNYVDFDIDVSGNAIQIFSFLVERQSYIEDKKLYTERLLKEKQYRMRDWFKKCLRNYTKISGRARRREFWFFYLYRLCILSIFVIAIAISTIIILKYGYNPFFIVFTSIILIIFTIVSLWLLLPTITVSGRRLHDIGLSAWWLLLHLIPCGGIVLLICFCINTDKKENQWGLPAK